MSKFFTAILFCFLCFFSTESVARFVYLTTAISSLSWSQAKSGIYLSIKAEPHSGSLLFCNDIENSTGEKHNLPANSCGLNIVIHTNKGGRKTIPLVNSGVGVKSTNNEVASILESMRYISREQLKLSKDEIITSVCVSYYYDAPRLSSHDSNLNGICYGDPVISPTPYPESCEVSMTNSIVDFGEIGDKDFSDAGVGNKPEGVTPQQRTLEIQCTNNAPEVTRAYLLLTSDKSSGEIIVSDNADVGFIISKDNTGPIYPNDFSKLVSFELNSDKSSRMSVEIQPVSVTGKTPETGIFSATAVLNIIFD